MTLVAEEDASRPIWPGCPSKGWKTGVHRLTGLPNGRSLTSAANMEDDTLALDSGIIELDGDSGTAQIAPMEMIVTAAGAPRMRQAKCQFQQDTGYQNPAGGKATTAATKESCCEQCWADEYCVVGVFVDKTCWMKYDNTGKIHKAGVVACVTTKTPHPPPKPHTMETHGPYNHGNGWM
jgi:beta-mannosidase